MSDVIFHSQPMSVYCWTATHIAAEKGISYKIQITDPASVAHRTRHPFGKMPVLEHGPRLVYETAAIAHYLDRTFQGPPLQPDDVLGQSDVIRWISIVNNYVFPIMNRIAKERLLVRNPASPETIAFFEGARQPLATQMKVINDTLSRSEFLVGKTLTVADSFLLPHLFFLSFTPEGSSSLQSAPAAREWLARMQTRDSFARTNPLNARGQDEPESASGVDR